MMELFLKLEGIPGECTDGEFPHWIVVVSYKGGSAGTDLHKISFVKLLDRSSPNIFLACAERRLIEAATFVATKLVGGKRVPLMTLRLGECRVTEIQPRSSPDSTTETELPHEEFSLSYRSIEWLYTSPDGSQSRSSFVAKESLAGSETSRVLHYEPLTCFIIMAMDPARPELIDVRQALRDTCSKYGIDAKRADDFEHDQTITEVLLERIQKSELLIADLSGERPNVYYEVGYAHAIGKRPILYRRKGTALHFDLSVHNVKEYDNLTTLKHLLSTRLEAGGYRLRPIPRSRRRASWASG